MSDVLLESPGHMVLRGFSAILNLIFIKIVPWSRETTTRVSFMRLDRIVMYLLVVRIIAINALGINGTRGCFANVWVLIVITNQIGV